MSWKAVAEQLSIRRESQIPSEFRLSKQELNSVGDYGVLPFITKKLSQHELEITNIESATELAKVRFCAFDIRIWGWIAPNGPSH